VLDGLLLIGCLTSAAVLYRLFADIGDAFKTAPGSCLFELDRFQFRFAVALNTFTRAATASSPIHGSFYLSGLG
jgi:hypothetical protein